ncbi:trimeric intracellular cation channel family protein [Salmonella enterica]|nr:trimeric intracellular cation channel family protein [Salmonella enterica subsp. enterica serovar Inganda]ECH8971133.1 trimeric intracellular cation channel family protein [Salmonella enterica subsp. enterica]EHT6568136.1 trimeric intracellular cation channel family protein [Salmonella enterica]EDU9603794.1 trimeric intracellular cation channel family protein [Salmonella enterica subsp. enterica]EIJ9585321.1 trimeric intracellular cation channel family protein [Salmonella enterica]
MSAVLHFIDIFGTFVFALSGAVAGVKKGFDVFGVFVIAVVTAIGGGVLRDICLSATPPAGLTSGEYFLAIALAVLCVSFFQKVILMFSKPATFFDAIGLGFFAAFGASKTWHMTGSFQLSVILGCVSAVGGGCMRDVLLGKSPLIFKTEIYASAAIVGAVIEVLGVSGKISPVLSLWLAIITCTTMRMLAIKYGIRAPSIKNYYLQ